MINGSSGLEKSLLRYSTSKLIKNGSNADPINVLPRSCLISFTSSFHDLFSFFECKQIIFLNFFPFSGIPVFEAAILAYKQKMRIFKMPQI